MSIYLWILILTKYKPKAKQVLFYMTDIFWFDLAEQKMIYRTSHSSSNNSLLFYQYK